MPGLFAAPRLIRTLTVEDRHGTHAVLHPDEHGVITLTVGDDPPDTILRIRTSGDSVTFEAVGPKLAL